ncbi:hypothetical protein NDU88_001990 [Pleurodeles waltl]|uniref:Uncharacterized protein n=1 Tax=Pleurodeles waltl TaxID=8319 RepID=A0AAV7RE81_PLEWA|nr:hypothetical protein NDU88_001990 [Pleurodeles waltl]
MVRFDGLCITIVVALEKRSAKRRSSPSPYSEKGSDFQQDAPARASAGVPAGASVSLTAFEVQAMIDAAVTKALSSMTKTMHPSTLLTDDVDSDYSDISEPERHVVPGAKFLSREELVDILPHFRLNLGMALPQVQGAAENLFPQFANLRC